MDLATYFKSAADEFVAAFDEAGRAAAPFFLNRASIEDASREVALPAAAVRALLELLGVLEREEELRSVVSALHTLAFGPQPRPPDTWPEFAGRLREHEPCINLLLILSGLPGMRRAYAARQIPTAVFHATLSDIPLWLRRLQADTGVVGLSRRILGWLHGHCTADLYRLGRLQFNHREHLSYPGRFFRSARNGRLVALAENGARISAEGFLAQPGEPCAWTADFEADDQQIRGFLIEPRGVVRREEVVLDADEWTEAIQHGAPVLDVHIPEGEPLDAEACRNAFALALDFFPRHYPELDFQGFICSSWLFDPSFLHLLRPASNILAFYQEFYCVPHPHGLCTEETLRRVFGKDADHLDEAPRDSSLKQAVYAHRQQGGVFRESGGLILRDDARAYGHQQYWRSAMGASPIR